MPDVTIRIVGTCPDGIKRYHGKAIDQTLDDWFETAQPEKIFATQAPPLDHTQTVTLPEGKHRIEYAPATDFGWEVEIFVNEESLGKKDDIRRFNKYVAEFTVGEPAGGLLFGWGAFQQFIPMMFQMMMMFMIMSLIAGMMGAFGGGE